MKKEGCNHKNDGAFSSFAFLPAVHKLLHLMDKPLHFFHTLPRLPDKQLHGPAVHNVPVYLPALLELPAVL